VNHENTVSQRMSRFSLLRKDSLTCRVASPRASPPGPGTSGGFKSGNPFESRRNHSKSTERGAELVEFALVLPILLVVIAGLWDFGRAFRTYQAITNAAREGARLAVVPAGINQKEAIQNRVKDYLGKSSLDTSFITSGNIDTYINVRNPLNDAGNTALTVNLPNGGTAVVTVSRVSVNYPFTFMIFGPVIKLWVPSSTLGGSITLKSTVTMQNQV